MSLKPNTFKSLLLATGSLCLLGCSIFNGIAKDPLFDTTRVVYQDEAGTTNVAVLSVARWEKYQTAVQPNFSLTADQALTKALPDTAAIESGEFSSISGQLSAQLGTSSAAPSVAPVTGDVTKLGTAGSLLSPSTLSLDPMVKYWAATALFEETQLLNRYVTDAAVSNKYYPYLVRVQVTLMPKRKDLPYDAYSSIGFFNDSFADYPPVRRYMRKRDISKIVENLVSHEDDPFIQSNAAQLSGLLSDWVGTSYVQWFPDNPRPDPQVLRSRLTKELDNPSSFKEALPTAAIKDGLRNAIADSNFHPTCHDAIESAIAYARDKSPRFSAFRGFDPSMYVDRDDILKKANDPDFQDRFTKAAQAYRHPFFNPSDAEEAVKNLIPPSSPLGKGGGKSRDEVQSILVPRLAKFGNFTISFRGKTTSLLATDSSAEQVQTALSSLASVQGPLGDGSVVVTKPHDREYRVSFAGGCLANRSQHLLQVKVYPLKLLTCLSLDADINEVVVGGNKDDNEFMSLDDFELSFNEMSSSLHNLTVGEWQDRVLTLLNAQSEHGSDYRPLVADPHPLNPLVIPLLVTDDLQSLIESRSVEQIRQMTIALAARAGQANIGGGLAGLDQQLRSTLGHSLDSTFTIAREADNIIKVRFGASLQAGSRYAMIPEAHNITLLVLVPRVYIDSVRSPMIHLETETNLVDAELGTPLPKLPPPTDNDLRKLLASDGGIVDPSSYSDQRIEAMQQAAFDNDFEDFQQLSGGPANRTEHLWLRFIQKGGDSRAHYSTVRIAKPTVPVLHDPSDLTSPGQIAAIDDSKKNTTVTILAAGDVFPQSASAELEVVPPATSPAGDQKPDQATNLKISTNSNGDVVLEPGTKPLTLALGQDQSTTLDVSQTKSATMNVNPQQNPTISTTQPLTVGSATPNGTTAGSMKVQIHPDPGATIKITSGNDDSVAKPGSAKPDKAVTTLLLSTQTTVAPDNRTVTFTFPSLASSNLATKDKPPTLKLRVHFFHADGEEFLPNADGNYRNLEYVLAKPAPLGIQVTLNAKVIVAKHDGTGHVEAIITGLAPNISTAKNYLTVAGADISSASQFVTGATTFAAVNLSTDQKEAGKIPVTANGVIKIQLANLNPTSNVTISGEDDSGAKPETPPAALIVVSEPVLHSSAPSQ